MAKKSLWDRHRNKAVTMTTALPLTIKVCGTCALWAGSRDFKSSGYLEIHPYSKGDCQGDSFKYLAMQLWQRASNGRGGLWSVDLINSRYMPKCPTPGEKRWTCFAIRPRKPGD
jgi:hypothetical protein